MPPTPVIGLGVYHNLVLGTLQSSSFKPPQLPDVVVQLLKLARDPNSDFAAVEKVVSRDPIIAAKIVGLSNSAHYARGVRVTSLRNAISRLGMGTIRDLVFRAATNASVFSIVEFQPRMVEERKHAFGCALLSKEICSLLRLDPEPAFLCGLLHDIGIPISLSILLDWVKKNSKPMPPAEELEDLLGHVHPDVGGQICAMWGLPAIIRDAVTYHHKPIDTGKQPMAAVVALANASAQLAGIGRPAGSANQNDVTEMMARLNFSPIQIANLQKKVGEIAAFVEQPETE